MHAIFLEYKHECYITNTFYNLFQALKLLLITLFLNAQTLMQVKCVYCHTCTSTICNVV